MAVDGRAEGRDRTVVELAVAVVAAHPALDRDLGRLPRAERDRDVVAERQPIEGAEQEPAVVGAGEDDVELAVSGVGGGRERHPGPMLGMLRISTRK